MVDKPKRSKDEDGVYNQISGIELEREVLIPEDTTEKGFPQEHKTIEEREEENPKLTDMQSAQKVLFPQLPGYLNVVQISRIFPESYNALVRIFVKGLLKRNSEMAVDEAIALVNTAMSIAIDGDGRIDDLVLAGAQKAEKEAEEAKKLLT